MKDYTYFLFPIIILVLSLLPISKKKNKLLSKIYFISSILYLMLYFIMSFYKVSIIFHSLSIIFYILFIIIFLIFEKIRNIKKS